MKLKHLIIIFFSTILSIPMVSVVDLFVRPFGSGLRTIPPGDYEALILRDIAVGSGGYYFLCGWILFAVLFIAMIVVIRRVYNRRLKRLALVAAPILLSLFFHYLLDNEIDAHIYYGSYRAFLDSFFANLLYAIPGYLIIGLVLFLIVMLTCYPAAILIDKLLLYLMQERKGNDAGTKESQHH
ncbi:MAG: hypothetical protein Q8O90_00540 [Elusimicrobiota bacterium]|nr:hypothetical protein [Elusimicrobiota bacterium]